MSFGRLLFSMRATRAPNIGCGEPSNVARVANAASAFVQFVIRIPSFALLVLIQIYQRTLSPALPVFFGSACGCRFSPSCSHYAADAIRTHGAIVGVLLAHAMAAQLAGALLAGFVVRLWPQAPSAN